MTIPEPMAATIAALRDQLKAHYAGAIIDTGFVIAPLEVIKALGFQLTDPYQWTFTRPGYSELYAGPWDLATVQMDSHPLKRWRTAVIIVGLSQQAGRTGFISLTFKVRGEAEAQCIAEQLLEEDHCQVLRQVGEHSCVFCGHLDDGIPEDDE